MSEEEILDIKRENYKLRKENFELIQENADLVNEKEKLKNDLLEVTNKLGFKIQELENSISKDKIREKIKKLESEKRILENIFCSYGTERYKIDILKELLGE